MNGTYHRHKCQAFSSSRSKPIFTTSCGSQSSLNDPRGFGRVLYTLPEVLLTALYTIICDREDFTDMGQFAAGSARFAYLKNFFAFSRKPSSIGEV